MAKDYYNDFKPNFNLEEILDYIKNNIPNDKKIYNGFFDNVYIYKYDGNERVNHRLVDYFKVVSFDDTNNLITICPIDYGKNMPYIDLNLLNNKVEEKVKRISQIDKFNKKYNLR